jgi:CheY-like chemotaxis protein
MSADNSSSPSQILVVEDNIMNQKLISQILKNFGFECQLAENGEEAIALLDSAYKENPKAFNLILMDLHMPVLDGFEATAAIREKESPYQKIPIIGLSANSEHEVSDKIEAAGMDGYIPKPIEIPKLLSVLQEYK